MTTELETEEVSSSNVQAPENAAQTVAPKKPLHPFFTSIKPKPQKGLGKADSSLTKEESIQEPSIEFQEPEIPIEPKKSAKEFILVQESPVASSRPTAALHPFFSGNYSQKSSIKPTTDKLVSRKRKSDVIPLTDLDDEMDHEMHDPVVEVPSDAILQDTTEQEPTHDETTAISGEKRVRNSSRLGKKPPPCFHSFFKNPQQIYELESDSDDDDALSKAPKKNRTSTKKSKSSSTSKKKELEKEEIKISEEELARQRQQELEQRQIEKQLALRQEIEASQTLTSQLFSAGSKTMNPFFQKRTAKSNTDRADKLEEDVSATLQEALWPTALQTHVGFPRGPFTTSSHVDLNPFTRRAAPAVDVNDMPDATLFDKTTTRHPQRSISPLNISRHDLLQRLSRHYSQSILDAPPCSKILDIILDHSTSLQNGLFFSQDLEEPRRISELLGTSLRSMASEIQDWLSRWRPIPKKEEEKKKKKNLKRRKRDDFIASSSDESTDEGDDDDWDDLDSESRRSRVKEKKTPVHHHILLLGPTGSGKSALLSALSSQLGYTLKEIHTGQKRGRQELLSILGEMTSSRLVNQGCVKTGVENHQGKKGNGSLAAFWGNVSVTQPVVKSDVIDLHDDLSDDEKVIEVRDQVVQLSDDEEVVIRRPGAKKNNVLRVIDAVNNSRSGTPKLKERNVSNGKTLIVIDDVDVLTGQDRGFWQGVASLLETSKRPIILIGSQNPFVSEVEEVLPPGLKEQLQEKVQIMELAEDPSLTSEPSCYIQLLLLSENLWVESSEIDSIIKSFGADIRGAFQYVKALTRPLAVPSKSSLESIDLEAVSRNLCLTEIKNILPLHEVQVDSERVWKDLAGRNKEKEGQLKDIIVMANWFDIVSKFDFDCAPYKPFMEPDLYQGEDETEVLLHLFPVLQMHNKNVDPTSPVHFDHQTQIRDWVLNQTLDVLLKQEEVQMYFSPKNRSSSVRKPFDRDMEWFKSVSNPLTYWDSCHLKIIQAELLPWLSRLCSVDKHTEKKNGGSGQSNGRMTRRSASKQPTRLLERDLSDEMYNALAEPWFINLAQSFAPKEVEVVSDLI